MKKFWKTGSGIAVVAAVALALSFTWPAGSVPAAANGNEDAEFGVLTAIWWQWLYSVPLAKNPANDPTGKFAHNGQPFDEVLFLAGTFSQFVTNGNVLGQAERTITVDRGTALFFPIVNAEWDNVVFDTPVPGVASVIRGKNAMKVPQLRAAAATSIDGATNVFCTLRPQGGPTRNVPFARLTSPVFSYFLPEESIYEQSGQEIEGWVTPAVSDGYWSYIPPLPRGRYDLHFGAVLPLNAPNTFTLDITYHITVK